MAKQVNEGIDWVETAARQYVIGHYIGGIAAVGLLLQPLYQALKLKVANSSLYKTGANDAKVEEEDIEDAHVKLDKLIKALIISWNKVAQSDKLAKNSTEYRYLDARIKGLKAQLDKHTKLYNDTKDLQTPGMIDKLKKSIEDLTRFAKITQTKMKEFGITENVKVSKKALTEANFGSKGQALLKAANELHSDSRLIGVEAKALYSTILQLTDADKDRSQAGGYLRYSKGDLADFKKSLAKLKSRANDIEQMLNNLG